MQRAERVILRATGTIVVVGVALAAVVTVAALLWPSLFQVGRITPSREALTPSELLALQQARLAARSAAQGTGLKVAAGVGALTAALLAWGRIELSRDERALDRVAHFSERYTRAVEQLGGARQVQLGGIYALERLAVESPTHRLAVIEVLCAFVREEAGAGKREGQAGPGQAGLGQPMSVEAALHVLDRNHRGWSPGTYDLRGADLSGVRLTRAALDGAQLAWARLSEAHLNGATLAGADLTGADVSAAHLTGADLSGATLNDADLSGSGLLRANLTRARLSGARLRASLLTQANLSGAVLNDADLTDSDLSGANLTGADLTGAVMLRIITDETTVWPTSPR